MEDAFLYVGAAVAVFCAMLPVTVTAVRLLAIRFARGPAVMEVGRPGGTRSTRTTRSASAGSSSDRPNSAAKRSANPIRRPCHLRANPPTFHPRRRTRRPGGRGDRAHRGVRGRRRYGVHPLGERAAPDHPAKLYLLSVAPTLTVVATGLAAGVAKLGRWLAWEAWHRYGIGRMRKTIARQLADHGLTDEQRAELQQEIAELNRREIDLQKGWYFPPPDRAAR